MRELSEYLSEREIFILENHPARSYAKLGEELGISQERVRQLKVHAERIIREEKHRERAAAKGQLPVTLTATRKDLYLMIRALESYRHHLALTDSNNKRKTVGVDPDVDATDELIVRMRDLVNQPLENYDAAKNAIPDSTK